jgi:hypothetical protein
MKILLALLAAAAALKFPLKLLSGGPLDWGKYLLKTMKDSPWLSAGAATAGAYAGSKVGKGINVVREKINQIKTKLRQNQTNL